MGRCGPQGVRLPGVRASSAPGRVGATPRPAFTRQGRSGRGASHQVLERVPGTLVTGVDVPLPTPLSPRIATDAWLLLKGGPPPKQPPPRKPGYGVPPAAWGGLGGGFLCEPPRPAPCVLAALPLGRLGLCREQAGGQAPGTGPGGSLGSETSSRRPYTHATTFRDFRLCTGPPAAATHSARGAHRLPAARLAAGPRPQGKGRDFRPDRATPGSDVGVSTCKMAAHHRQNTAGRRKVQVWEPGSSPSRPCPPARPTNSEQMPRAAIGRGSGSGRVGRGAAGREGWGRGANGFWRGRGAGGGPSSLPGAGPGTLGCSVRSPGLPIARVLGGLGWQGWVRLVLRPPASPVP